MASNQGVLIRGLANRLARLVGASTLVQIPPKESPPRLEMLCSASEYRKCLHRLIAQSQEHIALYSLYVDDGDTITSLEQTKCKNVDLFVDQTRLGRSVLGRLVGCPTSSQLVSSKEWMGGVFHIKWNAFDWDRDLVVSGANLSPVYLQDEKRTDRYLWISKSKTLVGELNRFLYEQTRTTSNGLVPPPPVVVSDDLVVVPLLGGALQQRVIMDLLVGGLAWSKIVLYSGYLNPPDWLVDALGRAGLVTVMGSLRHTNPWIDSKSRVLSTVIPSVYGVGVLDNLDARVKCGKKIVIKGWNGSGTFHAKGLHLELGDKMVVSLIGSSNFSRRSFVLDDEILLLVATTNEQIKKELTGDLERIMKDSVEYVPEQTSFSKYLWKFGAKIFGKYL